jgi:hypothetical protein
MIKMMTIVIIIMIFSNTYMTLISIIAIHDYDSTLSIDSHPFLRAPSLHHFIPLQYPHCHIRLFHQLRNRQLHQAHPFGGAYDHAVHTTAHEREERAYTC